MRFFKQGDSYARVPAGRAPEDCGVDPASAEELPRMPRDHEKWEDGKFVDDKPARDKAARRRLLHSLDREGLIDLVDTALDEMDERLAALERLAGGAAKRKRKRIGE